MRMQCRRVNINEICKVERAVTGKNYKPGTCFVKLSAVDESVGQLKDGGILDSRYAALEPKCDVNTDYLYAAVERAFPEFLARYRTTINLQVDTLKHFELLWHEDEDAQAYVANAICVVNKEIRCIEEQIENEKKMKRWYLDKMMI